MMDTSKITMPEDQKQKCHTIIHGAAVAAGGAGSRVWRRRTAHCRDCRRLRQAVRHGGVCPKG